MTVRSIAAAVVSIVAVTYAQAPKAPEAQTSAADLKAAIANLGKFDDATRMAASRAVRRAPVQQAVPALIDAASGNPDGYVRFRALVLLSGFNDPRARDVMLASLEDPNDRLRTVAYHYFERNPEPGMGARLLKKVDKETDEFVRPALTRALAAYGGDDPAVQKELSSLVMRGDDLFRSAVIEALGDYKGAYALAPIMQVAQQDGPLQEDAVLALGKIGDKRALATLETIQKSAPRVRQPPIAAAFCLMGVNCESHEPFIVDTAKFAVANTGFQDLLRAAARSLGALGAAGHEDAAGALIDLGVPARDPARSPLALALGTIALRNTALVVKLFRARSDRREAALLLRDAFDMLEEDFDEERFFADVRHIYWNSPADSADRAVAKTLIETLEF